jgi:hypothetical protein
VGAKFHAVKMNQTSTFPLNDTTIYRMVMEETRCGVAFQGDSTPVLMIGVKCSHFRAKAAHLVGHLPPGDPQLAQDQATKSEEETA